MTPYDIPRAFARLIDAARNGRRRVFGGIRFRTRFDTGATTWGVALFGDAGMRPGQLDRAGDHRRAGGCPS
jgi:hypothetical protein